MYSLAIGDLWPGFLLLGLLLFLLFKRPIKWLFGLFLRSSLGLGFLYLWSIIFPAMALGSNVFNALILGLLGLPGFGLLLLLQYLSFA